MKKFLKILLKTLKIFLGVLLLLYIGVFIYVSLNKKSIISQVTAEISKKINGKISVGDVELSFFTHFPTVSVLMNNVQVTDSMYIQHKHPFLDAKHVFAKLSIMRLIKKQPPLNGLRIVEGQIYLYTDTTGYSNSYLFKKKADSSIQKDNTVKNELRSVILKKVGIIIDDRRKEKLHDLFVNDMDVKLDDKDGSIVFLNTEADILIHQLGFNLARGSYLKEKRFTGKFNLRIDKQANQLQFDSINIKLSGQKFNLSGRFDLKPDLPQFNLRIHTRNISYQESKSLMTERIAKSLSLVELDKPLDIDASISGPLRGGDPLIFVQWTAEGTQLKSPFLDFENASFNGYFTNEVQLGVPRKDPNSKINLSNFTADWHDMKLRSKNIEIMNLSEPVLSCDLNSDFALAKLNELIGSNTLELTSGDGAVNITYKGPLQRNSNTNSLLNGVVSFKNGTVVYKPRDVEMKNVNGLLSFKNSDVFVQNLQCNVLNNKIVMEGTAKNLLTLINTEPGKATIDWKIFSPSLNLGSFVYLLKQGKKVNSSVKKNSVANAASRIDAVLEKSSLRVKLDAAKLYYKKFAAGNVNADITLLEDKYIINNVSMQHAGGRINMNGTLLKQRSNKLKADLNASMQHVDVRKVFDAFDNFGQQGITGQNLEGDLTTDIKASLGLDDNGAVVPSSVQADVNFSLFNGALVNYEPIKKLQNIIFKKRDFENIRFAELKNRLEINNGEVKINRMEIQSTVLSFFAEGTYSMKANGGNTDISIQVPLNNLKKRGADYNPENIGTDKKGGKSIFIRGRPGADGNVAFKIDLFNKFKKEKEGK